MRSARETLARRRRCSSRRPPVALLGRAARRSTVAPSAGLRGADLLQQQVGCAALLLLRSLRCLRCCCAGALPGPRRGPSVAPRCVVTSCAVRAVRAFLLRRAASGGSAAGRRGWGRRLARGPLARGAGRTSASAASRSRDAPRVGSATCPRGEQRHASRAREKLDVRAVVAAGWLGGGCCVVGGSVGGTGALRVSWVTGWIGKESTHGRRSTHMARS